MTEREKPLSRKQKSYLSQLCARAYERSGAVLCYATVDEYRHDTCMSVCGIAGLTAATQRHYVPLQNAFARAAGEREIEDRTPQNRLEREIYLLRQELERHELSEGYAVQIMMNRLRLSMPQPFDTLCLQLGADGVQQVKFTIINRARAKQRKMEAEYDLPPATEPHASAATMPPGRLAEHFGAELVQPAPAPRRSTKRGKEAAV